METNNRDYWRKGSKASKQNFDKRYFAYDPKEFRSPNVKNSSRYSLFKKVVIGLVILLFVMSMF